jgi:predicted nucleic acid-binding protein
LRDRSVLGECGATAIHAALLERASPAPSVRTIGRILERRGALDGQLRVRRSASPRGWYLPEVANGLVELDSFDAVTGLVIEGGIDVEVLNAVSLHGGLVGSWPLGVVSAKATVDALIEHWRSIGLPAFAQFDNDTRFQGAHQHADSIGRVIRLCIALGVVPIFAPPRETGFQAAIENFNGLWQAKVRAEAFAASATAANKRRCQGVMLQSASMEEPVARSDELPELQRMLEGLKGISGLNALGAGLLHVRAVFDSNIVLGDLRWLAGATDPKARTATLEAIDAGLITAYAPDTLRTEVEAHFDEFEQQGLQRDALERAWSTYSKRIVFVPVDVESKIAQDLARGLRDPTDLPFLLVHEAVAADVICTRDKDIIETGIEGVLPGIEFMLKLRDYGRVKAIELKVRVHEAAAAALITVAVGTVVVLVKLFLKAPTWLKIALAAAAALPMLHEPTRARILRFFARVKERLGETWTELQPHIHRHIEQSQQAAGVLPGKQKSLLDMLPQQKRLSLRAAALAAVAEAKKPVETADIASRVMTLGYRGRSGGVNISYLSRVLRSHDSLVEVTRDRWAVRQDEPPAAPRVGG